MANQYQALLEPVRLGPLDVANRIVSTAHGSFLDFYRPGVDPERYVAYQERRARGGVGLTILQPLHVHATSQTVGHHRYDADDLRPKLDLLGRRVHAHGTRVLVQLIHFGAEFRSDANEDLLPLWSFSGTISPSGSEASHEMTTAEVHEVVAGFGRAAALAAASGLDGVELNATHGYLLQQSFTPLTNTRSDEWGEPMRFLVEVMRAVRHELGPDRVLSVRISVDDFLRPEAGGLGPAGLREVAQAIVATGLADMINHSEGARAAHYARSVATYRHPHGEFLPLTAELRRSIDAAVPVVGVGRITTPELATEAVLEGRCDLVAMTRAQIADPDLVTKLRAGGRIRPCVGANQGCVDRMLHGLPITCFHNPEVGQEVRWARVGPTRRRRRLVVVGGGPAGLKAAEVAARRGHEVVLVEAGAEVGGRLRIGAVGDAAELLGSIDWLTAELEDLGVKAQTGCELDERGLADLQPEVVVLATGARPDPDALAAGRSDGSVPVVSLEDAIAADLSRRRVLVIDQRGDAAVARTAERVLASGADVVVATPMASNGAHLGFTHVKDHLEAMWTGGAEMEASTTFAGIADGAVTTRHVHSKRVSSRPFDVVVAGTFGRPDLRLAPAAERLAARVLLAGDVVAPRTALHAFREGALVAAEV